MSKSDHVLRVVAFFAFAIGTVLIPFIILGALSFLYGAPPNTADERAVRQALAGEAGAFGPDAVAAEPVASPALAIARAVRARFADGTEVVLLEPTADGSPNRAAEAFAGAVEATSRSTTSTPYGTVRRLWTEDGTHLRVFDVGGMALAVSGADEHVVLERVEALPLVIPNPEGRAFQDAVGQALPYLIFGFLVYMVLLAPVWLRVASRLMTLPAAARADGPVREDELRTRLARLERPGLPFMLSPGQRPDDLVVSWNTVDAAWIAPLFHMGRRRRIDRMRLRFDAEDRTVRALDSYTDAELTGEAVPGNVTVSGAFSAFRGLSFDAIELGAIPGIVWEGENPEPEPGYVWHFDRSELKRAVARVITDAGWTFRPVASFSRWLNG